MLFNSLGFAIFLPITFLLYWKLFNRSVSTRNLFLLMISYVFYGWWDVKFLILIAFSSIVDFTIGINLEKYKTPKIRKLLLASSLAVNLGVLGFFKYYNFFIDNFISLFANIGIDLNITTISIILPVGISFYTFQTLSYTIDVYRNKLTPSKDIVSFFAFVSFFPQLVAGPIERATHLLPQFSTLKRFDLELAKDGLRQILWGLFKKVVIADTCGMFADEIFNDYESFSSISLINGAVFFAFQIYGDFSGYSDIAIGTAKLFGFELMTNFRYPYFSRDIGEFWRRWHISLSTWFRDYLYIPLGGSRGSTFKKLRNVIIIFTVSGFWHGANWTFIVWGVLNGLYFIPLLLTNSNRNNLDVISGGRWGFSSFREFIQIGTTFILTTIAWVFFRSDNLNMAFDYLKRTALSGDLHFSFTHVEPLFLIALLLTIEWYNRHKDHPLLLENSNKWLRRSVYLVLTFFVMAYVSNDANQFIYFQF
ncbi:MAG: MBOAT family protein [Flavobacteriales bacterium]|nr:MBOAT family protein [Flavobacteriales bacterium]